MGRQCYELTKILGIVSENIDKKHGPWVLGLIDAKGIDVAQPIWL
jgi:hypothetical protein